MEKQTVKNLARDLARGRKIDNYSCDESNEVLREAMKALTPFDKNGKIDRKAIRRNGAEFFEILEEVVNEVIHEGLEGQFAELVEYRNLAWGDTVEFEVPQNELYRVAEIVDGNADIRRQQLRENSWFTIDLTTYGVKIFDEYHRFLAGRVDWVKMVAKIAESMAVQLKNKIFEVVMETYGNVYTAPYHVTATGTPDGGELLEIAEHIKARTGDEVAIWGTKSALRKLEPEWISNDMKRERNELGYFGVIEGLQAYEIPNSHKIGTDEFVIPGDFVLLLPQSPDRLIKVINEGDAVIQETAPNTTAGMAQEYFLANKFGIAVISSRAYGFYRFS